MDFEAAMQTLAQSCWGRSPIETELIAMVGELQRDVMAIAATTEKKEGRLFYIEPATFDRILAEETKP